MKKAFTLIELLVVVLIIGILAAIALPQYQVAVAKAQYQQIKIAAESLYKAQQIYYMANGVYPTEFEGLDISLGIPTGTDSVPVEGSGSVERVKYGWGWCSFQTYGSRIQCGSWKTNVPEYTIASTKKRNCDARTSNTIMQRVCASETGDNNPSTSTNWMAYVYP